MFYLEQRLNLDIISIFVMLKCLDSADQMRITTQERNIQKSKTVLIDQLKHYIITCIFKDKLVSINYEELGERLKII